MDNCINFNTNLSDTAGNLLTQSVNKFTQKLDQRRKLNEKIRKKGGPRIIMKPIQSTFVAASNWKRFEPNKP
jgi:hypothetical protein